MPERLRSVAGTPAEVLFADGSLAGTLGQIADAGFELVRPAGDVVIVPFDAIGQVADGRVLLTQNAADLDMRPG